MLLIRIFTDVKKIPIFIGKNLLSACQLCSFKQSCFPVQFLVTCVTGIQANESYMMILVMIQQSCGIITNHQYDVISAHKIISQS